MRLSVRCLQLVALTAVSVAGCAERPTEEQVFRDSACRDCRVDIELLATIGDEGAAQVGVPTSVARVAGGFLAATRARPGELLRFDQDGAFRGVVGRRGDGPGEYQDIARIAMGPADTVIVVDIGAFRLTTLSPELAFVRTAPLRGTFTYGLAALDSGALAVSMSTRGANRQAIPSIL